MGAKRVGMGRTCLAHRTNAGWVGVLDRVTHAQAGGDVVHAPCLGGEFAQGAPEVGASVEGQKVQTVGGV
eukprot:6780316-Prymnesium_polylepis.1